MTETGDPTKRRSLTVARALTAAACLVPPAGGALAGSAAQPGQTRLAPPLAWISARISASATCSAATCRPTPAS
ncbi:hypothetical protein J2X36_000135 [Methylobacterium sp. BE186]|uniref:hypothetical protein n=1 Tax=Methylobacterium sp. BE186 TaxID=2817715 RepID=UPI002859DE58|nr:hypothetical protein [Methylobacterium sp. BE186]MDR7035400.1 hypothetical protein [Methylobacterium sp. BE186]